MANKRSSPPSKSRKQTTSQARSWQRFWPLIGLAVVALGAFLAFGFFRPTAPAQTATLPAEISVQEAYRLYQDGYFLLDVRTQEEWDAIHVPNATLIPLDQLPNRLNELPKDRPILVICRSGNRSQVGRDILRQNGFEATSISGGIRAWQAAGYPIVVP